MTEETKSWLITGGIALAIILLAWWGIAQKRAVSDARTDAAASEQDASLHGDEESVPVPTIKNAEIAAGETVTANDQAAGSAVVLEQATLKRPSWIAIKDTNDWVLGAAWFAASGERLTVPLLRATKPGEAYQAVIFVDDGDKRFDRHADTLLVSAEGAPVSSTFRAE